MSGSQLIFNSFPRSGNVFMTNIASQTLALDLASVHIPEIYQVRELSTVAIFRKPEDSISSLLYKQSENVQIVFDKGSINHAAERAFLNYQKYIEYATKYSDNIHIVNFENVRSNPAEEIKKIANKFNINYVPGKESFTMEDIYFQNDRTWKDDYDGHMPREKNEIRLQIEKLVSELDFIKEANDMHNKIIRLAA